jgi:MFS family permease
MVFPLSLALVMISFPEEERGTAIGFYGLVGTAGLTLGPLVGGVFTEYLSWRWIFAINPIVMVAVIFVVATIWREPVRPDVGQDVDWRGLAILATALGALVFAIMQASTWGWGAPATVTLIVVGLVALVLFRYVELRTDDPLIDVTLFGRPSFTGANLGVFMAQLSKSTVIVFLPLYLQSVLDFSAIEAGLALMPGMAMNLLLALPGGRLVDRVGPGWPLIVGLGGLVVAHVWIAGAVDIDSYALLLPALLTWGAFTVATFSGSLTAIANSVPIEMQGQAAGISNESQMVGGALGIAVLSAMQTAGRSWTVVFGAVAVVAVVVFVIGLLTVDRSRPQVATMPDVAMA